MDSVFSLLSGPEWLAALCVGLAAGTVKGMVGFGVPLLLISGLSLFMAPDLALAGLILPALASNGMLAFNGGMAAVWRGVKRFRLFLLSGLAMLIAAAQLVRVLPADELLLLLGLAVTASAALLLLAPHFVLSEGNRPAAAFSGALAGFAGGFSGAWGAPTVSYLTAIGTEKRDQMRLQGVIYGLGSVSLLLAHLETGVLRGETLPLSAVLVLPVVLGMRLGGVWHDRVDQAGFRRATLLLLLLAGLNLIRRGLAG
jgi:hypothetical protein